MKAEFRVDGQVVAQTTNSFTMGSTVRQSNQYFNPANGTWDGGEDNDITVGEYNAIGIDLQGIGAQQMTTLQAKMNATKAKLIQYQQNVNDATPLNGLTKEDLVGDIVQSGIAGYFAQVDSNESLSAQVANNVIYRLPSYGRFFTAAQARYWFGIARNVSFPGVVMDVDYLFQHVEAKDADPAKRISFIRQINSASSLSESTVPELMFRNPNLSTNDPGQVQAVSAIKAFAIAATQGQKIYTLNKNNQALHNAILQGLQISQDVKSEIANGLASGKEVTVHEKDINVNGWIGSGYTILDPVTGAGAYKIAGGPNGGMAILAILALIVIMALAGIQFLAIYGGYTLIAAVAGGAGLFATPLLIYNLQINPLLILEPRAIGLVILAIGIGSLMGSLGLGLAIALLLPVILALAATAVAIAIQLLSFRIDLNRSFFKFAGLASERREKWGKPRDQYV